MNKKNRELRKMFAAAGKKRDKRAVFEQRDEEAAAEAYFAQDVMQNVVDGEFEQIQAVETGGLDAFTFAGATQTLQAVMAKQEEETQQPEEEETDRKSLPYREYFGDMLLEPEEKERRIQMADDLEIIFLFLFVWALNNDGMADTAFSEVYRVVEDKTWEIVEPYVSTDRKIQLSPASKQAMDNSIRDYIAKQTRYVVDNTDKHFADDYYTSHDRARFISENQVNGIENDAEMYEAFEGGYTSKTWVAILDKRTRDTHAEIDGTTLPIAEPFMVGDSLMMYPMDESLGADPEEIVNCRCHVEYGNEFEDPYDIDESLVI